jgi:hypothetical protein
MTVVDAVVWRAVMATFVTARGAVVGPEPPQQHRAALLLLREGWRVVHADATVWPLQAVVPREVHQVFAVSTVLW